MENRIEVTLSEESKNLILQAITGVKIQMPYLIKIGENERKSLQQMDDGRKPFTEKAHELATRVAAINPGDSLLVAAEHDIKLYSGLAIVENELEQLLEMVRDTKQLAGAEAYEVSRFIYMKAKMALKMKEPGMQSIVDELGKLYKQASTGTSAKV
ncbi:MAG TPA: hypothetical protein P5084_03315 [Paludibacter sp.]|nr:hypothetical protein [Paludibacter sp.]